MIASLVFLYFMNGHVVFEKKSFPTMAECNEAGPKRAEELLKDPRVDDIMFGACIPEEGQNVQK